MYRSGNLEIYQESFWTARLYASHIIYFIMRVFTLHSATLVSFFLPHFKIFYPLIIELPTRKNRQQYPPFITTNEWTANLYEFKTNKANKNKLSNWWFLSIAINYEFDFIQRMLQLVQSRDRLLSSTITLCYKCYWLCALRQ